MKVSVYCEVKFLDGLVRNLSALKGPRYGAESEVAKNNHIRLIEELVYQHSTLHFEDAEQLRNRAKATDGIYYKSLIKQSQIGGSRIIYNCSIDKYVSLIQQHPAALCPLYLLSGETGNYHAACKKGLIIDKNQYQNIEKINFFRLFQVDPSPDKNEFQSWEEVFKAVSETDKVYIVDQYLLENFSKDDINWKALLKGVCSLKSSSTIKVYILVRMDLRDRLKRYYKALTSYVESLGMSSHISIILQTAGKEQFHDRIILFDYAILRCGRSLNFLNQSGKVKHPTTIQISGIAKPAAADYISQKERVLMELAKGRIGWDRVEGAV